MPAAELHIELSLKSLMVVSGLSIYKHNSQNASPPPHLPLVFVFLFSNAESKLTE